MENKIILCGTIIDAPQESEMEGKYRFFLSVKRTSGKVDVLPIYMSHHFYLSYYDYLSLNNRITILGNIETRWIHLGKHEQFKIFVWARQIETPFLEDRNDAKLEGRICALDHKRETPLGRVVINLTIANNLFNFSYYVPCIAWGKVAERVEKLWIGDGLLVYGRLQSREYTKVLENGKSEIRTCYEFSVGRYELIQKNEARTKKQQDKWQ